jgi:hypothetical protein
MAKAPRRRRHPVDVKRLLILLGFAVIASAIWVRYFPIIVPPRPPMRQPYVRPTAVPTPLAASEMPITPPNYVTPDALPTPQPTPEPTPVAPLPSDSVADRVQIRKAARELTLYFAGHALKTYGVALGTTPAGAKELEGDGRTPEGRYFITGRNPQSKYHLALRVSYPNAADRARAVKLGKSAGGDIMIHGLPNGFGFIGAAHRLRDWTIGCVAVTDEEIEEIWRVVPDGCVVDIEP